MSRIQKKFSSFNPHRETIEPKALREKKRSFLERKELRLLSLGRQKRAEALEKLKTLSALRGKLKTLTRGPL
jgi:hypothetical protein